RFADVWHELQPLFDGATFIAAHNAGFDRGVLRACLEDAGLPPPRLPFVCTMHMARRVLGIYPTGLAVVAARLNVALNHHDALSDAHACAQIVIAARKLREDAHRTAVMAPLALSSP
ncbi:MAG TPA: exonuclease domain-containing protein, partial [Pseudomonadota bacterium]|nr:exonuclease domain-containing protein [Pseudomonadota bacterium]